MTSLNPSQPETARLPTLRGTSDGEILLDAPLNMPSLKHIEMMHVLDQVRFRKGGLIGGFRFGYQMEGGHLQVRVARNGAGPGEPWNGRWWRLSDHMTHGELVQTAFKAVMTALEHEAREQFTFLGQAIFDPHYDVYKLVDLRASEGSIKGRETP